MKIYLFFFPVLIALALPAKSQFKTDTMMYRILSADTSAVLQKLIHQPDSFRVQIIYTRIDRNALNQPWFTNYYFHVSSDLYFYPASSVKLPLALLSLEKLNQMKAPGVDKFTRMTYDSSFSGQQVLKTDSSSETGYPSIAQFIRKAFLISDNDAYNRMYEFLGQERLNSRLQQLGYKNTHIVRQFLPMSELENRHTNAISFLNKKGELIYFQPPAFNIDSFTFKQVVKIGNAYLNASDSLIHEPMEFTRHNKISLEDLQHLLQTALFPMSVPADQRFQLNENDYLFIKQYLSQYPSETPFPKYDTTTFFDSYVKFYFQYGGHHLPEYIRVFNKVGWAYGFLTDVSFIVDFAHQTEFILSTTVYTNADGVLNDNVYEYESVALPFLYRLGQDFYQYDLHRTREHIPDLRDFRIPYDHRDPADKRPSIRVAGN